MKYLDCHVHMSKKLDDPGKMLAQLDEAGVAGAVVLSFPPERYGETCEADCPVKAKDRLKLVMDWAKQSDRIYPFFWIDPMDEDALEQVDMAVEAGIASFKVICDRFYPYEDRPMEVWHYIAQKKKPILFHSGILYSPYPASINNRPVHFEQLFTVPNLRFALAHVSWPWHDECMALYGHWQYEREEQNTTTEMFIDTTPGTPKYYREEVLTKLYHTGIRIEDNILFGTDCVTDYNVDYCKMIRDRDQEIFARIGVTQEQQEKYFGGNLLRFLGKV